MHSRRRWELKNRASSDDEHADGTHISGWDHENAALRLRGISQGLQRRGGEEEMGIMHVEQACRKLLTTAWTDRAAADQSGGADCGIRSRPIHPTTRGSPTMHPRWCYLHKAIVVTSTVHPDHDDESFIRTVHWYVILRAQQTYKACGNSPEADH